MTVLGPKSDRLRVLEMEYELATKGLAKGLPATFAAMLSGLMTLLAAAVVLTMTGKTLLTGSELVIIFGILATAIIVYFAFVFGRAAKIKAKPVSQQLEIIDGHLYYVKISKKVLERK